MLLDESRCSWIGSVLGRSGITSELQKLGPSAGGLEGKCGDKLGRAKTLAERWLEVSLGWAERWVDLVDVLASAKVLG